MRSRLALPLAAILACAAGPAVRAQTTIIRGIHEPARVTPIDPQAPAPEPTPALAEPDASATAVAPVTVEAKRLTRPEVEKQAYRYVQGYATPTAKLDQFARWREAICIEVTTHDAAGAARITARIGEVAKTVGVKVLKPGCDANVQIIFADRP